MKKIAAALAGLALAAGVGVVGAGPALAGTGDSQYIVHASGGLGGTVGLQRQDYSEVNVYQGNFQSWSFANQSQLKHFHSVRAGSGYCVWKQTYLPSGGNPRGIKVVDTTYGKINGVGQSSRWWTLGTSDRVTGNYPNAEQLTTDLRIFAC